MSRISRSLTAKLTVGVLSVALSLYVVVAGLLFLQSRYMIRQLAREHAASVLNTALQQVINQMNLVETAANANLWLAEAYFEPDSLKALARSIVNHNRHTYGCLIANQSGVFTSIRETEYKYPEEAWYQQALATGKGDWVVLNREDTQGQTGLDRTLAIYSRPIIRQGKAVGVLSTGMSFRQMSEMIYSMDYPYPNAYFVVQDGEGRILLHPDSTLLFTKTALGNQKSGKDYVFSSAIPKTDWSLTMVCPAGDVMANYHSMVLLVVILDFLGVLLITLLVCWGVRRALAPIGSLAKMSDQIATGHYECTIPVSMREDAVGRMQNSFVGMQFALMNNVVSIKRATERLRIHNEKLDSAMKQEEEALKRKTLFLQNVMHQIRTPLNIIMGFGQVLRDEKLKTADGGSMDMGDEELKNIILMMKHNAVHLNRMVMMLYDSSEMGTIEEKTLRCEELVSCNAVARECIDFTKENFPDVPIEFYTELPDSTTILTNHLFLMRTIRELVYNAAKYSDAVWIRVSVTETASTVQFTIEDKGPGLPEAMNYEFFTKLNDLSEGLGLGLPLTKRHAENLGGNMVHDESYHDGCRFVITMPK